MNKTALTVLIEHLEKVQRTTTDSFTWNNINGVRLKAISLLQKEREDMMQMFNNGLTENYTNNPFDDLFTQYKTTDNE